MSEGHLVQTQRAFDAVAADYDGPLGNNALVRALRARTVDAVTRSLPPGSALLDLGCGTGLDAVALAERGYRVTAIDWSGGMVRRTQERAERAGLGGLVTTRQLGIHELDQLGTWQFDGAYSDLGALNCVPDLEAAAHSIAARIRPGGVLVSSVIGRVCPWELAIFSVKRDWTRARTRFAKGAVAVPLDGRLVWTTYYSPAQFRSLFEAAGFRQRSLRALGLLTPPPYASAFAERHPGMTTRLQAIEDRIAGWPGLRQWGDHFLIVMERRA